MPRAQKLWEGGGMMPSAKKTNPLLQVLTYTGASRTTVSNLCILYNPEWAVLPGLGAQTLSVGIAPGSEFEVEVLLGAPEVLLANHLNI
eukprot:4710887-Amphidinium_carterae.1